MGLRWVEKKESDFRDIWENCGESHHDEFVEDVCEVGENNGGNCYPWECPLCNFISDVVTEQLDPFGNPEVIELVEVIKEVISG